MPRRALSAPRTAPQQNFGGEDDGDDEEDSDDDLPELAAA
jgi:hypothetical protein